MQMADRRDKNPNLTTFFGAVHTLEREAEGRERLYEICRDGNDLKWFGKKKEKKGLT